MALVLFPRKNIAPCGQLVFPFHHQPFYLPRKESIVTPEELKRFQQVYRAEMAVIEAQRNIFSVPLPEPTAEPGYQQRLNASAEGLMDVLKEE